jgi:hypothetical protein
VLNIALSIAWARSYGITGVIAATVVAYALCNVLPVSVETVRLLARAGRSELAVLPEEDRA